MDRPSVREGVDMLWALQLRRENKAILGRLDNTEKQVAEDAAEYRRLLEVERERVETLTQEVKEIKEGRVFQKELQAYKDRETARDARDAFFATGAMGGLSLPKPKCMNRGLTLDRTREDDGRAEHFRKS